MNLHFDIPTHEDEEPDGSLERARTTDFHVERDPSGDGYLIAFEDSEDVHDVTLERGPGGWTGDCRIVDPDADRFERCPGFAHHDGPCAHLWAVRSWIARERRRDRDERHAQDVDRARADGVRRVRR